MNYIGIDNRFDNIVNRFPDKTAIKHGNKKISYRELDDESNKIFNFVNKKINYSENIAIFLDDKPNIIVSVIGITKSHCVYVPINPSFPKNRIKVMINEVDCNWIITQKKYLNLINLIGKEIGKIINVIIIDVNECGSEYKNLNIFPLTNLPSKIIDIRKKGHYKYAYIYFTSGSTGKPKAVLGRRKSLEHFIDWEINEYNVNESFNISQLTSYTFDPFLRDVFVSLCSGATLHIPNDEVTYSQSKLLNWIMDNEITLIHMVPSLFKVLVDEIRDYHNLDKLKYILLAGESMRGKDIKKFVDIFSDRITLINLYGPTETTLAKFHYRVKVSDVYRKNIPVGKPITNTDVLVLDTNLKLCATGSVGEVYIRTPYISSGYYNDKELNKKVFIKNPFTNNSQDLIYRTGDLGRILSDGNLEIIGREDSQVKVRGIRVNTNEIENVLLEYKGIKEVVVMAREDRENSVYLCAYIVALEKLSKKEIRLYLQNELPEYMVPSFFIQLDSFPLTVNGKINKNLLQTPTNITKKGRSYQEPRDELEKRIVSIWKDILDIEFISSNDNFFELGGHSIKATKLQSRIYSEINIDIKLSDIFKYPTIEELAKYIREKQPNLYSLILPVEEREYYPASAAQKRMYAVSHFDDVGTTYNTTKAIMIEGVIKVDRVKEIFSNLIKRHEILRTRFATINGELMQFIYKNIKAIEPNIEYYEVDTENDVPLITRNFIRSFDLKKLPLFRIALVNIGNAKSLLILDMHHIITDGSSKNILLREFIDLYLREELPDVEIQYKDFAIWQDQYLNSRYIQKQEAYWLKKFEGEIAIPDLPLDFERVPFQTFRGDCIKFKLDHNITKDLFTLAKSEETTVFMVIISVYKILLSRYSDSSKVFLGLPVTGRLNASLEHTLGIFINTLVLVNKINKKSTFLDFLKQVKVATLEDLRNQEYQYNTLIEKLQVGRDSGRNPLFDTMFAWQNNEISSLEKSGIKASFYEIEKKNSPFDLLLQGFESNNEIQFSMEYSTNLFKKQTIESIIKHFNNLILSIIKNPYQTIQELDILSENDKVRILSTFNNPSIEDYNF